MAARLAVVLGGITLLAIVALVVMKLLGGNSGFDKPSLLSVAQDQTAITQLLTSTAQNTNTANLKNAVVSTQLTIATQQTELLSYLAEHRYKPKDKELSLKVSGKLQKQLQDAQSTSNLDSTLKTLLNDQLGIYQRDLSAAFNKAGPNGKKLLKSHYEQTNLLLEQLNQQ
jgi:predicted outer membrane protein